MKKLLCALVVLVSVESAHASVSGVIAGGAAGYSVAKIFTLMKRCYKKSGDTEVKIAATVGGLAATAVALMWARDVYANDTDYHQDVLLGALVAALHCADTATQDAKRA